MKNIFFKWLLAISLGITLSSTAMMANAYQCEWRDGHKVCWHNGEHHCRWVEGHWHNGYYYRGHQVCWAN